MPITGQVPAWDPHHPHRSVGQEDMEAGRQDHDLLHVAVTPPWWEQVV